MIVALYLRVSTGKQDHEPQEQAARRLAAARWPNVPVRAYRETRSGAKVLPVLAEVLEHAHRGELAGVVVFALDRLGRTMWSVVDAVRAFDARGVPVVSVSESWMDTSGPLRAPLLAMFGWVAERERERTIERVRAGVATARARGKRLGRPPKWVDPAVVLFAFSLKRQGRTWKEVQTYFARAGFRLGMTRVRELVCGDLSEILPPEGDASAAPRAGKGRPS